MRRTAPMKLGPQTPVWGEQFNGQPLWAWPNFAGGREPIGNRTSLVSGDFIFRTRWLML